MNSVKVYLTSAQLIAFVHNICKTKTRGKSDLVFIDLAKAFDKVYHAQLPVKIDKTFQNSLFTSSKQFVYKFTTRFASYLSYQQHFFFQINEPIQTSPGLFVTLPESPSSNEFIVSGTVHRSVQIFPSARYPPSY